MPLESTPAVMTGLDLIVWAVKRCEVAGVPPTDAAILEFIRGYRQ